jgi:putative flippase GtrA
MTKRKLTMRGLPGQVGSYAWVGCVGFAIEAIILTALATYLGVNIYLARAISFTVALTATWYLNGRFTFPSDRHGGRDSKAREYGRYAAVQVVGAMTNLAVFGGLIAFVPSLKAIPVVPLAVGAALGLLINFGGSRLWVFRG